MQRVAVARQPVDQGLIGRGLVGDLVIRGAVGWLVLRATRAAVAAPSALAADEHRGTVGEQRLPVGQIGGDRLGHDHCGLALVVHCNHPALDAGRPADRQRPVEGDRLLAMHQQRRVEGTDVAHRRTGAPSHDDREGREHLLVDAVGVLGGVGELVGTRADTDGVEQGVLAGPGGLSGLTDRSNGFRIQWHRRAPRTRGTGVVLADHSHSGLTSAATTEMSITGVCWS